MSKLNDLIKEMCPNGVNFYKIKEISSVTIGEFVHKNKQSDDGQYPVYNGGTSNTGFYDEYNNDGHKVIISARGANAGFINRVKEKYWAGNSCYTININDESKLNWNYLYQYLKNNQSTLLGVQQTGSIPAISKKQVEEFKIPVPPIEVQEEIVRILDKFSELEAELEVELEARKNQYEFWRGTIISNSNVKVTKLSDLCIIGDGLHGTPHYVDESEYYFINGNNLNNGKITYDNKTKKVSKTDFDNQSILLNDNTLLMSINGTIGKVSYYNNEKIMLGKSVAYFNIKDKNRLSKKYLYYLLQSPNSIKYYQDSLTGSTILNLGLKSLREFEVQIPSIDEQNRVANILERFDKLINDITVGIPAEIELRRKQYEYYRNKLLSFEELYYE